ncbi:HdeD family acid-resistance protein [Utexia brackfieldae]|uniref:HdeD family acid-resistance protein n=1 Tax=Utexia brackfieldae TaxID=3074108 RepID=UPI00370D0E50
MKDIASSVKSLSAQLKHKWGWFVLIGIVLVILGMFALGYQFMATVFSVYYIAILIIFAGVAQMFQAFQVKGFEQSALSSVMGVIYLVAGIVSLYSPIAASSAITLVIAMLFLISGLTQIIRAFQHRGLANWGWLLFSAVISLLLGIIILIGWPTNSLWLLGLFLGIDLIFQGWAYISIGFAIKTSK